MRFVEVYGGWQERRLTQEEAALIMTTENSPASTAQISPTLGLVPSHQGGFSGGRGKRKEPVGRLEFPPHPGDDVLIGSSLPGVYLAAAVFDSTDGGLLVFKVSFSR